ncbi:MAG: VOC family protein [Anaerolineae bacterium]
MIKALAHVCFTVSDLQRSLGFYQGSLGLEPAFYFTNQQGEKTGVYLRVGGRSFIELFTGQVEPLPARASYRHFCLEVDDIRAVVADLRAKGVDVSDVKMGADQSWQAWLTDPDGNRIELHQYTAASWQAPFVATV